jgi:beta-galactosidase
VRPRTLNQTPCIQFPDAWQDGQSTGAWLVKEIAVEGDLAGKAALLRFDSIGFAVRACVNGTDCGCGHSGYAPVELDVTQALKPGRNVIQLAVTTYF